MTRKNLLMTVAASLLFAAIPVGAQSEEPGKGVARISLIQGDVSVRRGDSGDWVAAAINAPLLAEDRVLTGAASRAEVQFDFYHRIRLAANSEIRLTQLEYRLYQIQVVRGMVTFSALKGGDAQVEINTPAAALRPVAWGEYRVTVFDDDAELTVRRGEAEVFTPSGTERLRPGRTMVVRLTPDNRTEFRYVAEIPRDSWDEFNRNRDRELSRAGQVYQYVSRDIYGAEDLYGHGNWVYVAPYGYCWRPVVAAGWAPYRFGRWVWLDWYGWTWVSYDPWGWAPYHYGRWFWWNDAWLWYPGAVVGVRHWWSPALVGWFGWSSWGGFTAGVGFGWGAVGWVPLAPFEPLYPWWGRRFAGYRSVNYIQQNTTIINNTNITNIYRNARVRDGVTVVRGDDFVRGQAGRPLRLGGEELQRVSVARGAVPFAPARESLRLADREPVVRQASVDSGRAERFYSRRPVERAERIPFDEQRRTFEQLTAHTAGAEGRREAVAERSGADRGGAGGLRETDRRMDRMTAGEDRGWRRAGEAAARPESRSGEPGAGFRTRSGERVMENDSTGAGAGWRRADEPARRTETRSGESDWRRFGDPGVGVRNAEANRTRTESGGDDSVRSGSGWRSFGDPGRGAARSESPRWSTGGGRSEDGGVRVSPAPRSESPRWSTGGERGRTEAPGYEAPRVESPRSESPRWSTGGDRGRTEAPGYQAPRVESPRSESPRWSTGGGRNEDGGMRVSPAPRSESPRMETPRMERQAEPPRGGEARPGPRGERGNTFAPMSRGGWSTGGGRSGGDASEVVTLRGSGAQTGAGSWRDMGERSSWSTGGGVVDVSPRSATIGSDLPGNRRDAWRGSAGRSTWSTGEGVVDASPRSEPRSEPRSYGGWSTGGAAGRTGWAADGFGGVRSAPSIGEPRSAPSYGGWSGGGGIRSGPGYSGAGSGIGGGIRSGGSLGAPPSMGGGGMRGGGSFGGGGVRSAPSMGGGGGVRGGRGR